MLPPCSFRCWPGPHDGGRCGARSRASRRSSCCEPLTRSSFCVPFAPSCCSVARCVCTRRGTDHDGRAAGDRDRGDVLLDKRARDAPAGRLFAVARPQVPWVGPGCRADRSEEHTSELQSLAYLVCRLLLEKKKKTKLVVHCLTMLSHSPLDRIARLI